MIKKGQGGPPCHWSAGRVPLSLWLDPPALKENVEGALAQLYASKSFDFGAGYRLMVGDDRQGFDRRPRQLSLTLPLGRKEGTEISGRAERP
jgi:hypothetical protein